MWDDPLGFTVVEAADGAVLAKRHTAQGVVPYDRGRLFRFHPRALPADAGAWHAYLARIAAQPSVAIIRAAPVDGLDVAASHRRLLIDRPDVPATLREVPRSWVALDWDGAPEAAEHDWRVDARGSAETAIVAQLPEWLRCADFVASYTGSHGFKPLLRLRSFHLLNRPVHGEDLKRLLAGSAVDPCLFRAVHLHYTATPLFEGGVDDPLPGARHHLCRRAQRMATVPALAALPPRSERPASASTGRRSVMGYSRRIEDLFSTMYEQQAGGAGFYQPGLSVIATFYAANDADADPEPLLHRIERTVRANCDARHPRGHVEELMAKLRSFARTLATRPAGSSFEPSPKKRTSSIHGAARSCSPL